MRHVLRVACLGLLLWPGAAVAQDKTMVLAAGPALVESGLLKYIVPRFALKTGVRVTVVEAEAQADALLLAEDAVRARVEAGQAEAARPAFFTEAPPAAYAVALAVREGRSPHAPRFHDWLTSEIGQHTVVAYAPESGLRYQPGAMQVAAPEIALPEGDVDEGEKLSFFHCGRCHVISDRNKFGGIGSTPSFGALRAIPDWQERFVTFWASNPHPSFTQVEGVTQPFDPDHPPHIAPVVITQEELAAIVAYAAKIPPKDLGRGVQSR